MEVQRLSWWLEWPVGMVRVGVVFLVGVTAVASVVRFPSTFDRLSDAAARGSSISYADREIAGGNGVVDDQAAVYEARARIPPRGIYHVAVGTEFEAESNLTVPYVASYSGTS